MLLVSPMCGPFFEFQSLFNYPKQEYEDVKEKLRDAMTHVTFCLGLCLEHYVNGRLFVFEHPAGASPWLPPRGHRCLLVVQAADRAR